MKKVLVLAVIALSFSAFAQDAKKSAEQIKAEEAHEEKYCSVPENTAKAQTFTEKHKGDAPQTSEHKAKKADKIKKDENCSTEKKSCCSDKSNKTKKEKK